MKKKLSVFSLLLVMVLSALLTACGSKKDGKKQAEDAVSSQEYTETVTEGGSVVVGITNDLDSLDPHKAVAAGTRAVLFNLFDGLVKPNCEGELKPAVAKDYKISEDGMKYTFILKDQVKFHNGKVVTMDDVLYSLKRCKELGGEKSPLNNISNINVVDDHTVELELAEANTELIGYLTFAILPADYDEQETKPVGTGPFRFVSYEAMNSFVMEKNPDYYGEQAHLDQVTYKINADTKSVFMELLAGSVDIFPYLTGAQASQLSEDFSIEVGNSNLVQALFLNNAAKPFDDVRVRQALCYAVNRQAILDMVFGGKGTVIGSNMFPNFKKYYDPELVNTYPYDLEKAKALLTEAGYGNGFEFTIKVPSNYQPHIDTAQVIVEQLKQIGVNAKIQLVEWASWLSDVYAGRDYEATVIGLDAELAPSNLMYRYNSDSPKNFVNYVNTEYDEIYKKAVNTINDSEKVTYYKQLQKFLSDDAASVYIQDPAKLVAVNKKLGGYKFYPVYVQDMASVYYKGAQK